MNLYKFKKVLNSKETKVLSSGWRNSTIIIERVSPELDQYVPNVIKPSFIEYSPKRQKSRRRWLAHNVGWFREEDIAL